MKEGVLSFHHNCMWVLLRAVQNDIHTVSFHSASIVSPFNRRCLSCEFKCGYVDVSFSHNMKYFLLNCKGEASSTLNLLTAAFLREKVSWVRAMFSEKCNWISAICQIWEFISNWILAYNLQLLLYPPNEPQKKKKKVWSYCMPTVTRVQLSC